MYNSKLKTVKVFLLLQYHWDKAFHLPGKFHFLVKTITDSDRLGLVYLNLAVQPTGLCSVKFIYSLRPTSPLIHDIFSSSF